MFTTSAPCWEGRAAKIVLSIYPISLPVVNTNFLPDYN
jgi:hypothetical protein